MNRRAFGIIELIGALAILAILTALLLPQVSRSLHKRDVFQTVSEAQVLEVGIAVQGLESAINTHLAQFGTLASANGKPLNFSFSYDQFNQVLLTEGLLDRPFAVRFGTNAFVRLVNASTLTTTSAVDCQNGAYDLDGDGKNDVVRCASVAEAVIPGVTEAEASAVNSQLDGPQLAGPGAGTDLSGRVIYLKAGPDGRTELHIHLLHK